MSLNLFEHKENALRKLNQAVSSKYLEPFANLLVWAYLEQDKEAIKLAEKLHICKSDIYALDENERSFCKEWHKENERAADYD